MHQAAATAALLTLFAGRPLYRLLPPAYAALWRKWATDREVQKRAPEQEAAAAALLAREKFVEDLVARPLVPWEVAMP